MKRNSNNGIRISDKSSVSIKNKTAGITLIALVITIIILLILSGVTITSLTGENGILSRAGEAKGKTEQEAEQEAEQIGEIERLLNNEIYTKSKTINGGEASSTNPTIPAGFKPVDTETAK